MNRSSSWALVLVLSIGVTAGGPAGRLAGAEEPAIVAVSSETALTPAGTTDFFVWPVSRTLANRKVAIISPFGKRTVSVVIPAGKSTAIEVPPVAASTGTVTEVHDGIDFAVPPDAQVKAARAGKILFAGFSTAYVTRADKKEKNRLIIVRHPDGMSSRYVHLNTLKVRPGQEVAAGDLLGTTSSSDELVRPVLHFEIRDAGGQPVNPSRWFAPGDPK